MNKSSHAPSFLFSPCWLFSEIGEVDRQIARWDRSTLSVDLMTDGLQVWMLINYCDVFLSFIQSLGACKQAREQRRRKNEEEWWMSRYVCIHELVYDYKVTSSPEDWMHAHRGLDVRERERERGNARIIRCWWWWWSCSHDWFLCCRRTRWWWQMKRQTRFYLAHQEQRHEKRGSDSLSGIALTRNSET